MCYIFVVDELDQSNGKNINNIEVRIVNFKGRLHEHH